MSELSVIIPSRNEMFLSKTVGDLLANIRGNTEIIVVLDGNWPNPPVKDDPKVTMIYHPQSIGQRAAMNEAAKISRAKYIMKLDAHCSVAKNFDVVMMADMKDDWTMVPIMRNLHVFDWVCEDGHRRYQGPSGQCKECGKPTKMDVVWIAKTNPQSTTYTFDPTPHFQYFNDFKHRPEYRGDLTETMSLQGSCFMMTREKYWELEICDESFGSWGSQGLEVAIKTWLSGGRVICNHKTWYAHCFRTQGGDFGFPYPISGRQVDRAKKYAHDLFFNNKWPKQKYPLSWLVEKFWPVSYWKEEDLKRVKEESAKFSVPKSIAEVKEVQTIHQVVKHEASNMKFGLVYYTDFRCDSKILEVTRKQIDKCRNGWPVVSVSLHKTLDWGENIVIDEPRGYLTMFKQILVGVKACKAEIIFLVEHDVLYHPSHFDFKPPKKDVFYYDENRWMVNAETGHALFYHAMSTSLMCAYRDLLIEHYEKRVERVAKEGYSFRIGFEPGGHKYPRGIDNYGREAYFSEFPSLDIRHGRNLTVSRWNKEEFRNKKNLYAWTESDSVPGWGVTKGRFQEILDGVGRSDQ